LEIEVERLSKSENIMEDLFGNQEEVNSNPEDWQQF
jgi:hypothetical protein